MLRRRSQWLVPSRWEQDCAHLRLRHQWFVRVGVLDRVSEAQLGARRRLQRLASVHPIIILIACKTKRSDPSTWNRRPISLQRRLFQLLRRDRRPVRLRAKRNGSIRHVTATGKRTASRSISKYLPL